MPNDVTKTRAVDALVLGVMHVSQYDECRTIPDIFHGHIVCESTNRVLINPLRHSLNNF